MAISIKSRPCRGAQASASCCALPAPGLAARIDAFQSFSTVSLLLPCCFIPWPAADENQGQGVPPEPDVSFIGCSSPLSLKRLILNGLVDFKGNWNQLTRGDSTKPDRDGQITCDNACLASGQQKQSVASFVMTTQICLFVNIIHSAALARRCVPCRRGRPPMPLSPFRLASSAMRTTAARFAVNTLHKSCMFRIRL